MDFSKLGNQASQSDSMRPVVHANRVLQADADVFAYECMNLDRTPAQDFAELRSYIEDMRKLAGAEHINLHLTLGLKSGREQMATVKPYQENRSGRDPAITLRVTQLRQMMANYRTKLVTPIVNVLQEADDSLSIYQLARIAKFGKDSSIIMSIDKDLWMVDGLHIDPKTLRTYRVNGYGKTGYKDVGNVKPKLVGEGTSWFWHQMLMGDKADNIPGLPALTGPLCERYIPLKKPNPKRKPLACGEAKAVAMLAGVVDDTTACRRVIEAYQEYYIQGGMEMFVEQAFLLWMRRTNKLTDVLDFLNGCGINAKFTAKQQTRLQEYIKLAKELNNESIRNTREEVESRTV